MGDLTLVYCLTLEGVTVIYFTIEDLNSALYAEVDNLPDSDLINSEYTVSFKYMTEGEINNMPEFDGF